MKLNKKIYIRVDEEMNLLITEVADSLGFKKADLIRFLLSRSLMQLKADGKIAGGFQNLNFQLKK